MLFGLSIGSMSGILCSASAGEALWHARGDPHHHVLRRGGNARSERGAVVRLAADVCPGLMVFGGSFGAAEVAINVEGPPSNRR